MKRIVLDFSQCKYYGEIQKFIKKELEFPEFYGENLDALWDCLQDYLWGPVEVVFANTQQCRKEWQDDLREIFSIFQERQKQDPRIALRWE